MKADYCKHLLKFFLIFLLGGPSFAQQVIFNRVQPPKEKTFAEVKGIVQDRYGYIWFASKRGLFKYDGYEMYPIEIFL